jgi:hypothetical protein
MYIKYIQGLCQSRLSTADYALFLLASPTVCRLQLLLVLASAVILGSESRGTCGRILLSQIRDFHFRLLVQLRRVTGRYSTPPPHGIPISYKLKVKVML